MFFLRPGTTRQHKAVPEAAEFDDWSCTYNNIQLLQTLKRISLYSEVLKAFVHGRVLLSFWPVCYYHSSLVLFNAVYFNEPPLVLGKRRTSIIRNISSKYCASCDRKYDQLTTGALVMRKHSSVNTSSHLLQHVNNNNAFVSLLLHVRGTRARVFVFCMQEKDNVEWRFSYMYRRERLCVFCLVHNMRKQIRY